MSGSGIRTPWQPLPSTRSLAPLTTSSPTSEHHALHPSLVAHTQLHTERHVSRTWMWAGFCQQPNLHLPNLISIAPVFGSTASFAPVIGSFQVDQKREARQRDCPHVRALHLSNAGSLVIDFSAAGSSRVIISSPFSSSSPPARGSLSICKQQSGRGVSDRAAHTQRDRRSDEFAMIPMDMMSEALTSCPRVESRALQRLIPSWPSHVIRCKCRS